MQQVATDRAYDDSIRMVDSIAAVAAAEAEMAAERAARVVTAPKYPGGTNALYAFLRRICINLRLQLKRRDMVVLLLLSLS